MPSTPDTNGLVGALLRDLAAIQPSKQSGFGYKRAAHAVLGLDRPIETLVLPDGTLEKIPNVGPKSEQVILEVLRTGASPTVERAIEQSGKANDIAVRRGFRENFLSRAQVQAALDDDSLVGPSLAEYHGDLQMHSTWSDGSQTLEDIVETGISRGYQFCAVTDHSYGLRIAGGVSMADLAKQHADIDRLNDVHRGEFRLIKGIEANIMVDGSVDMTHDELAQLELVLIAPHSSLRSATDQTARMLAAVHTPHVHILGHPRGRVYGTRAGVQASWDDVFDAAARAGVAVEIDGDPSRQDLDFELARAAVSAECLFALDSDAHSPGELRYAETAIAHARLAGVPRERIINCWPRDELLAWLASKR
ncbi:MAG TPA: DNA polymerase/3'-5' exonuclease PolX [Gemmatimonadaceae bacterium]|jgi:histidinol phosphatase-like PHP family hydrolase|nr:DNA polymerase/3'-5' exonuclease PolX [Gemmatimonadaceae bacterium]